MTISAALVLLAVIWFMLLLMALPLGTPSQAEDGHVVKGTHASAPADPKLRKKVKWVTLISFPLWGLACWVIISGVISVDTLDFYNGIEN